MTKLHWWPTDSQQFHINQVYNSRAHPTNGPSQPLKLRSKVEHPFHSLSSFDFHCICTSLGSYDTLLQRCHSLNDNDQIPLTLRCINSQLANLTCQCVTLRLCLLNCCSQRCLLGLQIFSKCARQEKHFRLGIHCPQQPLESEYFRHSVYPLSPPTIHHATPLH